MDRSFLIKGMDRGQKLLVLAALEVNTEQNTGSGHNTAWAETVDVVLHGRRGLFDYSDAELDEELDAALAALEAGSSKDFESVDQLIAWIRRLSLINSVDAEKKDWDVVPVGEQIRWRREDSGEEPS